MLTRVTAHILEIEYDRPQANKYKVLHEALENGYRIQFDVLYYSPCLLEEEVLEDIGNKEGELIRQYRPVLNYQIPRADNYKRFTTNKDAKFVRLRDIVA
jgi:hypothetical protein